MKKIIIALVALAVLAGGAFLVYQNLPQKRYARHMVKARLFVKQGNFTAGVKEYETAYNAIGTYTPYASLEVLKLTNHLNIQDKKYDQALEDIRSFLRQNPGSKEGRLVMARLAFQLGRLEPAFEALNGLLGDEPGHYQGRLLLAQVRARQGRLDLAEEQLQVLARSHPDSHDVVLPLVQNLMSQRKFGESRALLRGLLAKNAEDTVANLLLVEGFLKERMTDSATAILEAWKKVDTSVTQPIAIQKARLASMLGNNAEALKSLRPYSVGMQPPIPVLSEMALTYVKMGALDSAIRSYQAVLEQNPPTKGSFLLLSHLLHLANRNPVKALELLKTLEVGVKDRLFQRSLVVTYLAIGQENKIKTLIASEPDSTRRPLQAFRDGLEANQEYLGGWALFNYYQMNEQPFMMLKTLDSLYRRWPNNALILRSYAGQLYVAGALPQALAVLGKLKNPAPEDEIRLLEINRRMGRTKEALVVAHRLEKANPGNRGINALLSDIYLARGETEQAIFHAERELAIDTGNVVCINNLAWIHGVTRGDLAKAEPFIRRLEKVKNSDPRVLDTIGWILARTGKLSEAEPYFNLALNILPDNPSLLYHIAYLKAKQGDKTQAAAFVKKALSLPGRFDERAEAQKLLAELG